MRLLSFLAIVGFARAQIYNVTTLSLSGVALNSPTALQIDSSNNVYIANSGSNQILKVPLATGVASVFSGAGTAAEINGAATVGAYNAPADIRFDGFGYAYVVDNGGGSLRRMSLTDGSIATLAGGLQQPVAVALDGNATFAPANAYVIEAAPGANACDIRQLVLSSGNLTTVAGSVVSNHCPNFANQPGTAAQFGVMGGVTYYNNALYIADSTNNQIRKVDLSASPFAVSTFIGTPAAGGISQASDIDGIGVAGTLNGPKSIVFDKNGDAIIVTSGNLVRKYVVATQNLTTIAGSGGQASNDGIGNLASFAQPIYVTVDANNNYYVVEPNTGKIRMVSLVVPATSAPTGSAAPNTTAVPSSTAPATTTAVPQSTAPPMSTIPPATQTAVPSTAVPSSALPTSTAAGGTTLAPSILPTIPPDTTAPTASLAISTSAPTTTAAPSTKAASGTSSVGVEKLVVLPAMMIAMAVMLFRRVDL